jgi:hypothetical protein
MLDKKLRNIKNGTNLHHYYIDGLLEWDESDIKLLNWLFAGLIKFTPQKYHFLYKNITVAKYKDDIEIGFPHTHENTIFLTGVFVKEILKFYNKEDINSCILTIGSIIIHECVHIFQRRDPNFFNSLYSDMGFYKSKKIINLKKYASKNRYNPDGVDLKWIYKDKHTEYVILSIYSDNAINISQVNLIGIELERIGKDPIIPIIPKIAYLKEIDSFMQLFGNLGGNNYHPNEISAEIISRIVIQEINTKSFNNKNKNSDLILYNSPAKDICSRHLNNKF